MRVRRLATAGALGVLLAGCPGSIKSKTLLTMFNTSTPSPLAEFEPVREEVAEYFRQNLPDAYWSPACVNALVEPGKAVRPLSQALACASRARGIDAEDQCFHTLFDAMKLPHPPPPEARTARAWALEQDVTRLETNLKQAIRATVSHYTTAHLREVDPSDPEILAGLGAGLEAFQQYQRTRQVTRHRARPVSTLVVSGGAAKGAYSAGAMWWLLSRLHACKTAAEQRVAKACGRDAACVERARAAPENACLEDRVDMLAGTSTGSLITVMLKDYFDPLHNRRQRALDMLVQSYTCSVNSDLYCVVDATLDDLGLDDDGRATGMVRFDGIARKLETYVDERVLVNPTEYFAGTVEFRTGRTFHLSSADRRDLPDVQALRAAVLASIAEPVLAEPVPQVGRRQGAFIDGGIRSGLPLLTPLMRGAERALVFVNSPMEPPPLKERPPNATAIGMRMVDLFAHQPIVGELREAEYRLSVKRAMEYERCMERLSEALAPVAASVPPPCTDGLSPRALEPPGTPITPRASSTAPPGAPSEGHSGAHSAGHPGPVSEWALHELCSGAVWPSDGRGTAASAGPGPEGYTPFPHQISRTYRSTWLFGPHELPDALRGPDSIEPGLTLESLTAAGFQFEPRAMWRMFVLGAAVAQQRCAELNETLGWHLAPWCGDARQLREALAPLRKHASQACWTKDVQALRDCPE